MMPRLVWFIAFLLFSTPATAHEIVGEVTPLMDRIKTILLLIENNKVGDAVSEASKVMERGLKSTNERVDRRFGTSLYKDIVRSLREKNIETLKKNLQTLVILLMIEKFDELQSTFDKKGYPIDAQKTLFWQGRNYFTYLLEASLAETDPITEQTLSRYMDKMLYRLEDGKWQEFVQLRQQLVERMLKAFNLTLPGTG